MNDPIDKEAVERRRFRLTQILSEIVDQAATQSLSRCPYRNQHDLCTAKFVCRNQGDRDDEHGLQLCLCDGQLDYRSAWEVEDPEAVLAELRDDPRATVPTEPLADTVVCTSVRGKTVFELADEQQVAVKRCVGQQNANSLPQTGIAGLKQRR